MTGWTLTGWWLAIVLLLVFFLGVCFGVMLIALMSANGRDMDE